MSAKLSPLKQYLLKWRPGKGITVKGIILVWNTKMLFLLSFQVCWHKPDKFWTMIRLLRQHSKNSHLQFFCIHQSLQVPCPFLCMCTYLIELSSITSSTRCHRFQTPNCKNPKSDCHVCYFNRYCLAFVPADVTTTAKVLQNCSPGRRCVNF